MHGTAYRKNYKNSYFYSSETNTNMSHGVVWVAELLALVVNKF